MYSLAPLGSVKKWKENVDHSLKAQTLRKQLAKMWMFCQHAISDKPSYNFFAKEKQ